MANLPEGQCPTQPAAGPPPTRTTNLQASLDSADPLHSPTFVFFLKLNCKEMLNSESPPSSLQAVRRSFGPLFGAANDARKSQESPEAERVNGGRVRRHAGHRPTV